MPGRLDNTRPCEISLSSYLPTAHVQRACEVVQGYWRFTIAAVGITSLCWFGTQAAGRDGISPLLDLLQTASITVIAYPVQSMVVVAVGLIFVPAQISRSKDSYLHCWSTKWLLVCAAGKPASTVVASVSAFQSHRIQLDANDCQSPTSMLEPFLRWFAVKAEQQQVYSTHGYPSTTLTRSQSSGRSSSELGSHRVELSPRAYDGDASSSNRLRDSLFLTTAPSIRTWFKYLQFQDGSQGSSSPRSSTPTALQATSSQQLETTESSAVQETASNPLPEAASDLERIVGEHLLQQFRDMVDAPAFQQLDLPTSAAAWADSRALFGQPDSKSRNAAWERIVEQTTPDFALTSFRKPMRLGLYLYCSRAVFHNATPAQVRAFYMDDQYKVSCDKSLLEWITLPDCQGCTDMSQAPAIGSETCFLFSRIDFPGPLAAREYTYARRVWDGEDGGCVCINKSCTHAAAPKAKGRLVDDYSSGFVIRSCQSSSRPTPSTELVIVYFEDSKVRAPGLLNLAISKGMWGSWQRMEGWFRDHVRMHAPQSPGSQIVPYPLSLDDLDNEEVEPFPLQLNEGSDGEEDEQASAVQQAERFLRQYQIQLPTLRILPSMLFSSSSASPPRSSTSAPSLSNLSTHTCSSSTPNPAGPSSRASTTPSTFSGFSSSIHPDPSNDSPDAATDYSDAVSEISFADDFNGGESSEGVYGDDGSVGSYPLGVRAPIPVEWLPLLAAGHRWRHAGASSVGRLKRTMVKVFTVLRGDRYKRRRRWASLRHQVVKVAKFAAGVKIMEAVLTVKGSLDTA